jgi:cold-inducible RNA-binding protein
VKIYLGNLSKELTDSGLSDMMQPFGTPSSAEVAKDRDTGASKGFGFVEFDNASEAQAAITGLDGKEVSGMALKVSEARPKKDRDGARH